MPKTSTDIIGDIVIKMIDKGMIVKVTSDADRTNNEQNIKEVVAAINAISAAVREPSEMPKMTDKERDDRINELLLQRENQ